MKLPIATIPEPTNAEFSCYNTGGVEAEVGEFLHGLVRMIKPERILETGTHKGIAASYMATALKENNKGKLITLEYEPIHYNDANLLFKKLELAPWIESLQADARTYMPPGDLDFIFLDTEPNLRFAEFLKFWPYLKPGGFIGIHDLHFQLGQTGQELNGMLNWPFGTMPFAMRELMMTKQLSNFHFPTPRGFYLAQRKKEGFFEV